MGTNTDREAAGKARSCNFLSVLVSISVAVLLGLGSGTASAGDYGEAEVALPSVSGELATVSGNSVTNFNSAVNLGDMNGDGVDDIGLSGPSSPPNNRGAFVLYTDANGPVADVGDLSPEQGYRIRTSGQGITRVYRVDDQNGDGIPDILLVQSAGLLVIYGLSDGEVADLPLCGATRTRCLEVPSANVNPWVPAAPAGGYRITGAVPAIGGLVTGDFNGDGKNEIVLNVPDSGVTYVLPNGLPSGETVALTASEGPAGSSRITGPPGFFQVFGQDPLFVGDINGDGRDDVAMKSPALADEGLESRQSIVVVYGTASSGEVDTATMTAAEGYRLAFGEPQLMANGLTVGVDGLTAPGRSGVAVTLGVPPVGGADFEAVSYVRGPGTDDPDILELEPPNPEFGYQLTVADPADGLGEGLKTTLGDLNGDGVGDLGTAVASQVDGVADTGRVSVVFSKRDLPRSDIAFGSGMSPVDGFAVLGAEGQGIGAKLLSVGDVDRDGIPDFAVSGKSLASPGLNALYVIYGKRLFTQARTGRSTDVGDGVASLNGAINSNHRGAEARFEYGTSETYGSETPTQQIDGSGAVDAINADLTGLEPETEYHYRLAVTNDLGLTRYGADRTFTTLATPGPVPGTCDADPSLPGCSGYCTANPTAMGCPEFDWCAANPGKCSSGPADARLTLISTVKKINVKRGKRRVVPVVVVNTGGMKAAGVKVCVKAPKRLVKVKRCVRVGALASGGSRAVWVRVKVKPKAKRGKTAVLKITASASGLAKRNARARVRVR